MFSPLRLAKPAVSRAFSTTSKRSHDLAKLTLIGHLAKNPELRVTKNDREYVSYSVATRNPPGPPDANGDRQPTPSTFHRVLSFTPYQNGYLQTLKKGSRVYVEASFELREPDPDADPATPQGQRQIFLKHEFIKVLTFPKDSVASGEEAAETERHEG